MNLAILIGHFPPGSFGGAELQAEADNARGLAFYRKMGFEQEGVQRRAYRRAGESADFDEILMVRFLD